MLSVNKFMIYFECDFCHKNITKKATNEEFIRGLYTIPFGWSSYRVFTSFTLSCNEKECQEQLDRMDK